jgi:hypothetical protein
MSAFVYWRCKNASSGTIVRTNFAEMAQGIHSQGPKLTFAKWLVHGRGAPPEVPVTIAVRNLVRQECQP